MEWLQEHMRRHLAEAKGESNVFSLRPQTSSAEEVGVRAVELVERAIQHIQTVEEEAAARHARAETLARNAFEELKSAVERVRAAESAHRAAEARVDGATARLREMEIELERTAASAAAAQTRIAAGEERVRDAEKRATEAENALKRIETLVHTLMLEKRLSRGEVAA
jgi:chromosome segregation ATPase